MASYYRNEPANQPVVIDNGSGVLKAGFAGGDQPRVAFSSHVGRPKHQRIMPGGALDGSEVFVGPVVNEHRGVFRISYPMEHGVVTNWDDMERVWRYVYSRDGLNAAAEDHPVLLTEAPLNPYRNREKTAEVFFESFGVPALYCAAQAVLSLYASGRTTGVVLDSGDGVTHCVPVYEGFALPHAVTRSDLAGRDITQHLQLLLQRGGYGFHTSAEMEVVARIKEECCYVAFNPTKEEEDFKPPQIPAGLSTDPSSSATSPSSAGGGGGAMKGGGKEGGDGNTIGAGSGGGDKKGDDRDGGADEDKPSITSGSDSRRLQMSSSSATYRLPDGQILYLGPERFRAPEVLFHPSLIGSERSSVQDCLLKSVMKADVDLRHTLFLQVVLSGGSTLFPGFGHRLLNEVRKRAPPDTKIRISAPPERKFSTWIGGSILASLATFKNMWVNRAEYEEHGASIINRRTL